MHTTNHIKRIAAATMAAGLFSLSVAALAGTPAGAAKSVVNTLNVGSSPNDIEASGGSLWTANTGDNTVQQIDAATGVVTKTITIAPSDGD